MTKRRVLCITGIRSEYFLQRSIFRAISQHPDLQLLLVVTGAHLTPFHGYSVREVEADQFPIVARVESLLHSDRDAARLKGAALQLQILAHLVDVTRPEWLLVTGDREEAMVLALCGAYMGIPTAHYSAGDRVVGNIDDTVRHAISRLAHLLLTTNENARQRLLRGGEEAFRVHNVGHAGLDRIAETPRMERLELAQVLGVPAIKPPYLVIIQHPLSSEVSQAGEQMRQTLESAAILGLQTFISYPNSDAGAGEIIRVIEEYRAQPGFHVYRTIADTPFINLLREAAVLIGNSSMGLLEAPFLRLPVVNVGSRQAGRIHADNVFFVPNETTAIVEQVRKILTDATTKARVRECTNPFGDGRTGKQVAELLASIPLDQRLLNKDLTY